LAATAAVLAWSFLPGAVTGAQTTEGQTGRQPAGNRARGRGRGESAPSPTANLPFDPHDFSGVWMGRGGAFNTLSNMEFVQTKDRLIEFFDFFYTHRTIYLDGRKLPDDPDPTWYGYSVGHWEGNTLFVETTGFNDQSWLDNDGHPHSDQMRIEENFQRVDHDTIESTMTLTDPKAYTAPWVSDKKTWKLQANGKMREDVCAPSDEETYKKDMREPAAKTN
jgi:hypothetical protein